MPKAIKSFTVDEKMYSGLVAMIKKHKADVSISLLLNNYIKDLYEYLVLMEEEFKSSDKYTVPMKYVIDCTKNWHITNKPNKEIDEEINPYLSEMEEVLDSWQNGYEADQKGIPIEYYEYVKDGGFKLSPDKKYVIHIRTGDKYVWIGGCLRQVSEKDSKKGKKK